MNTSFRVGLDTHIKKGDIAIRDDGAIFMLNWSVQNYPNCYESQSIECNGVLNIKRVVPETTDANGRLVRAASLTTVVDDIPCVHAEYAGRPDYAAAQGTPGIMPDHLIMVSVQWNSVTRDIQIGDEFTLDTYAYRVVNTTIAEVHVSKNSGILKLYARRVAGGGGQDD